ncbi:MAG TPA: lamin tail domain-containing protein [Planctomycetota bacterium]|nr:lamin tail domain-containing protein [Planctomycetota bacterium]
MRIRALFFAVPWAFLVVPVLPSDFDVVVSEIHYGPLGGLARDEFIELHNRGPSPVDLGGWQFVEGVSLVVPPGTILQPRAFLLVSPDAVYAAARHGVRALGNYTGRLDNSGEIITLVNAEGYTMSRVHYGKGSGRGGLWPSRPDGLGPSLEILDPHAAPDVPRSWASSLHIDGTPGRPNSHGAAGGGVTLLVGAQGLWKHMKGTQEASDPPLAWTTVGFDDAAWVTGAGGFGYGGAETFTTELDDMQGSYTTFYIRSELALSASQLNLVQDGELGLSLTVRYDDGFVAYLNGTEVARENASEAGTPPDAGAVADGSLNAQAIVPLESFAGSLHPGLNVLAVHGLNSSITNGDFLIEAELTLVTKAPSAEEEVSDLLLNEVKPTEGASAGFIEIFNSSASSASLAGHAIVDTSGHRFEIAGVAVPPRGRAVFTAAQLGFSPALGGVTYVLVRRDAAEEADVFVDAVATVPGVAGASFGRVPDGGEDLFVLGTPSQGAANSVDLPTSIVLSEIHYHPPHVPPGGGCAADCSDSRQWIELHNQGSSAVNISGWSLTKGVTFNVPLAPPVSVPAGGYIIVASSRSTFLAEHPGFDPSRVLGDWSGNLAHDSDTVNLRDALGNRVDHVQYGDGKPVNDLEPLDGEDDRTFLSSEWPPGPDGTGRTLELTNPLLDNRDGGSWATGPVNGTPGAANASFTAVPFAVVGDVEHSPAVPLPAEPVIIQCRVSASQPISSVEALWHREDAGGGGTVNLEDDGALPDERAGDGIFTGSIPGQPNRAVVGFQVRARLADGKVTLVPRSPAVEPYNGFEGPYFLYQVLAAAAPVNPSEDYYVVMAAADLEELETRPVRSNVLLPCTFIHVRDGGGASVRYLAGIRYRGAATRNDERKSYRIELPSDAPFGGITKLNLNASSVDRELLASDLFRRAGMPYPQTWSVNLTFQGSLDPRYVRKEHLDGDFLNRFFGDASDSGNLYRALDPDGAPLAGDLTYFGEDPESYVPYYDKRSNREENDYTDVIELCRAFDPAETPNDVFPDTIDALIDANQWARYLALQSLMANTDGSIQSSSGEDYLLYRVPETSGRPDSGRWVLIPWDIEETFSNAGEQLFRPSLRSVRRFLTHPRFAPLYYANLVNLRSGAFSRFELRQRFVLIDFLFGFGTIDGIDTFITNRIGFVDSQVPVELSAGATSTLTGTALVEVGDIWSYWKGTERPAGGSFGWTQRSYVETGWDSGPTGIGYGDGDDATVLDDMEDNYLTVYARRTFTVDDPSFITSLDLEIDYDDGFVAYLNGAEVARRGAPGNTGSIVPFDAEATSNREAGNPVNISLDEFRDRLVPGANVLAIQVLNGEIDSSDLSLIPRLVSGGGEAGGIGCGTVLYSTSDAVGLAGRANAHLTKSVTVGGSIASYDPFRASWTATVSVGPGDNTVLVEAFDGENGTGQLIESKAITIRRLTRQPVPVSGTLAGVTSWTAAEGPYLMTDDVVIPAGSRLDIGPGTLVIGESDASIIVRGEIQAIGTDAQPILFRALSCSNRWGGIAMDETGTGPASRTNTLRHADLEFGGEATGFAGCVAPVESRLLVDHCSFRFLEANAIDGTDARVEVRDSLFEKINEGVHCTRSTVIVVDSTFRGMVGDKDAIDFDLNGTERSRIERCLIEDGSDDGIDLQATTVDIRDNVIRNVSDKAISLELNGPLGPPTVTGNLIYDSGTAIALKSGVSLTECHHNTLVGNQEGLNLFAKAGAADGGHGIFHSLIVWSNIADVKLDRLSTAVFTHSNVWSGAPPGEGNISIDPGFVDAPRGNFALRASSPCAGTGKDGSDMGAVPFTGVPGSFVRADASGNGSVEITDVIVTLDYLFRGGAAPACLDAADSNDDGSVDLADSLFTLFYLFASGRNPPPPFPGTGPDPTGDALGCEGR